jgi:hypothetical protein
MLAVNLHFLLGDLQEEMTFREIQALHEIQGKQAKIAL